MTPDRIKISQEFNINGLGLWLTAECPVAPGEDVIEEFSKARSIIIKSFETLTHSDYSSVNGHPMSVKPWQNPEDARVNAIIEDINLCTSIDEKSLSGQQAGLIAYKDAAGSDPRILAAYDLKMLQLKRL